MTRSPTANPLTSAPIAVTTPAHSPPSGPGSPGKDPRDSEHPESSSRSPQPATRPAPDPVRTARRGARRSDPSATRQDFNAIIRGVGKSEHALISRHRMEACYQPLSATQNNLIFSGSSRQGIDQIHDLAGGPRRIEIDPDKGQIGIFRGHHSRQSPQQRLAQGDWQALPSQ